MKEPKHSQSIDDRVIANVSRSQVLINELEDYLQCSEGVNWEPGDTRFVMSYVANIRRAESQMATDAIRTIERQKRYAGARGDYREVGKSELEPQPGMPRKKPAVRPPDCIGIPGGKATT